MYSSFGTLDDHVKYHVAELLREAEQERLASLVVRPSRAFRGRIADVLVTIAEWIEGSARENIPRTA